MMSIKKEMIHQILQEDQWKWKTCTIFVSHKLVDEQKQRLTSCQNFIQTFCGLVVRVPDYRSRGLALISGTSKFSEK
jgi:hypothetical protein